MVPLALSINVAKSRLSDEILDSRSCFLCSWSWKTPEVAGAHEEENGRAHDEEDHDEHQDQHALARIQPRPEAASRLARAHDPPSPTSASP
jgi:hypothetical protein